MVPRLATLPPRDRMSVVEADQPLAIRSVQSERVIQSMGLLRRHRHASQDEPRMPMAALRVHHENLPVEVKKQIECRVVLLGHDLSYQTEAA